MFSDQGGWSFEAPGLQYTLTCDDNRFEFRNDILAAALVSMTLLAYRLPVGDSARNKMCQVYEAVLKALRNPKLLLRGAKRSAWRPDRKNELLQMAESLCGKLKLQRSFHLGDDGIAVVAVRNLNLELVFRPAALTTKRRTERLNHQLSTVLNSGIYFQSELFTAFEQVQAVRSSEFAELIGRIAETPVPLGQFEANPLHSAPEIIKKVHRRIGLNSELAAYYLQVLTLADPTDQNVMLWNGWTSAKIKALGKELVARNLVVEEKRSRAGRSFFLPGGWENLNSPHLPLETWKLPLFQLEHGPYGVLVPLIRVLPLSPVHKLFAEAWYRTVEGDLPE